MRPRGWSRFTATSQWRCLIGGLATSPGAATATSRPTTPTFFGTVRGFNSSTSTERSREAGDRGPVWFGHHLQRGLRWRQRALRVDYDCDADRAAGPGLVGIYPLPAVRSHRICTRDAPSWR